MNNHSNLFLEFYSDIYYYSTLQKCLHSPHQVQKPVLCGGLQVVVEAIHKVSQVNVVRCAVNCFVVLCAYMELMMT